MGHRPQEIFSLPQHAAYDEGIPNVHPTNGSYPDSAETRRARAFKTYVEPELEVPYDGCWEQREP